MISVRNLSKSYVVGTARHHVFRDVSFSFPEKTNIGIMGPNGAGKSTLLRILGGIDYPDSGEIQTNVSISWPLGLRGGFVGHMSGRENCRMICNAYGIPSKKIPEKLDAIQEMSGIGNYFDQPVAYYSSGMGGRLGFAMSMAFDFDYFLIDEVTSVGDGHFKKMAKEALDRKRAESNIIMVSHSMGDLRKFCDIAVFIKGGHLSIYNDWEEAIEAYLPKSKVTVSLDDTLKSVSPSEPVKAKSQVNSTIRLLERLLPKFQDVSVIRNSITGKIAPKLMEISNAFYKLELYLSAYEYCRAASEEDPYLVQIFARKAHLEGILGKPADRRLSIEHGLKLDPHNPTLNLEKARLALEEGSLEEATAAAKTALSVKPKDVRGWVVLATAQYRLGHYHESLVAVTSGLEIRPDNPQLKNLKYPLRFALGGYTEALQDFEKSGSLHDQNETLLTVLQTLEDCGVDEEIHA